MFLLPNTLVLNGDCLKKTKLDKIVFITLVVVKDLTQTVESNEK